MFWLILLCMTAHCAFSDHRKSAEGQNNEDIIISTPIKRENDTSRLASSLTPQDYVKIIDEINQFFLFSKIKKMKKKNRSKVEPKDINIKVSFNHRAAELIGKLTNVLEDLNENMAEYNKEPSDKQSNNLIYLKAPLRRNHHERHKRDVESVTDTNVNATDTVQSAEVQTKTVENKNSTDLNITDANDCNNTVSGRRNFNSDLEVSNAVKTRLLSYINEYFNDITNKIDSLRNVKKTFSSDNEYNIGYMIANIDMLEVNLKNLKSEMERNRHQMGEKHILDLFDKVKVSNSVVTSLLSALKSIIDKQAEKEMQGMNNVNVVNPLQYH